MQVFAIKDKVADKYISVTISNNEESMIRSSLISILMDFSINDVELYRIGLFDEDLGIVKPLQPQLISWEAYKFPVDKVNINKGFLSIEQIEEFAKKKKHEFLDKTKLQIKDLEHLLIEYKGKLHKEEKEQKPNKKLIKELKNEIKNISTQIIKLKEVK